jgi:hypothetical protein
VTSTVDRSRAKKGTFSLGHAAGTSAFAALLVSAMVASASEFEPVPDRAPAELLPAALASGTDFHVVDPVHGDGLMHRFVLDSRFGRFEAYGRVALALRVREIAALTELARSSRLGIVAGGVGHGVESQVKTATGVVTHPVTTVSGIPKGIAHLFSGYSARGEEALAAAGRTTSSSGGAHAAADATSKAEEAGKQYALQYLGVTAAERAWYLKLGVSPYTDNKVLRDAVRRAAQTEAIGSFGVKFASLPAIPGISLTQRAVDAIYNEDPAAVRARTRRVLAGYGMDASEIENWLNAPLLNPARQVLLLSAAARLDGVAGRAELFRHSLGLTSDAEVQVYLYSAGLLVKAHETHPMKSLVPGVRLPAAELVGGRLVVCGAFEAVYWTEDVANGEAQVRQSLPPQPEGAGRELWLLGSLSDRARNELRDRGWAVHESDAVPQ